MKATRVMMVDDESDDAAREDIAHTSGVNVLLKPPAQKISVYKVYIQALLAKYAEDHPAMMEEFNKELEGQKLTPLLWSVQQGEVELVRELLDTGLVDLNMRTAEGANALFLSVFAAEAERADSSNMAKSFEQDLPSDSLKYPFEKVVLLLRAAGASWATVLDDNKLLQCQYWTALSHYPDVMRYICRKHAETAAAAVRESLQAEHTQAVQQKDGELAALREAMRSMHRKITVSSNVIVVIMLLILIISLAELTGHPIYAW
jgi:hypothetical protein